MSLIEAKRLNLIVAGIPESSEEEAVDRTHHDFTRFADLVNKSLAKPLEKKDLFSLMRIGKAPENEDDRPRLILVKFKEMTTRETILRNNSNLKLKEGNISHNIYINVDHTKSQRETLKALRSELKARLENGEENLVIRNFKIVPRFRDSAHVIWAQTCRKYN